MRIALLITGLGVGGAERQVVDLADAFAAAGHEVLLVCLGGDVILQPTDSRVQPVALGMTRTALSLWRTAVAFRRVLADFRPDVVHSHLVHANLFARLLRPFTPMPVLISSAHNSDEEGWWRMLGYRVTNRLADLSTNVSTEAVQAFEGWRAVPQGKMQVVYNGIATDKFRFDAQARDQVRAELGVPDDGKLLLAVGRLDPPKDYPNLLRALALLQQRQALPRVVIAGDGPLLQTLKELTQELGLKVDQVTFLGLRQNVAALMSAADVFVLSSAWEGFGLVVAEAMACERPVVATDCGGVSEVLGDCGWLITPRAPAALADALAAALQLDAKASAQLGSKARDRIVTRYSMVAAVEAWLNIYADCQRKMIVRASRSS